MVKIFMLFQIFSILLIGTIYAESETVIDTIPDKIPPHCQIKKVGDGVYVYVLICKPPPPERRNFFNPNRYSSDISPKYPPPNLETPHTKPPPAKYSENTNENQISKTANNHILNTQNYINEAEKQNFENQKLANQLNQGNQARQELERWQREQNDHMNNINAQNDARHRAGNEAGLAYCHNTSTQFINELKILTEIQNKSKEKSAENLSKGLLTAATVLENQLDTQDGFDEIIEQKNDKLTESKIRVERSNINENKLNRLAPYLSELPENAFNELTTEIYLNGKTVPFQEKSELTSMMSDYASIALDVLIGITPVIGVSRDVFESATGINALTGKPLTNIERGFATAGALTLGIASGIKTVKALTAIEKLAPTIKGVTKTEKISEHLPFVEQIVKDGSEVRRFNPINPGPLHIPDKKGRITADSFRSGSYSERLLTRNETFYRVASNENDLVGPYWTKIYPKGHLQSKIDFALIPEFNNNASWRGTMTLPKGTLIYEGIAAGQTAGPLGPIYIGGGHQIYLKMEVNDINKFIETKLKIK
jgi:hypothetical protein